MSLLHELIFRRRKCLWDSFASRSELLRTIDFIARLCGGEHAFLQSGEASRQSWTGSASAEDGVECFGVSGFVDLATGGRCDCNVRERRRYIEESAILTLLQVEHEVRWQISESLLSDTILY